MQTDLRQVGLSAQDRKKGMQAMLYSYDQLNRLTQARSLTYDPAAGFSRGAGAQPYDVTYSYDPNGNLLTLQRNYENGDLWHDYTYGYYDQTNKLREVIPILRDTLYNGSVMNSNYRLYNNVTVNGNYHLNSSDEVELKAMDQIDMLNNFDNTYGAKYRGHQIGSTTRMKEIQLAKQLRTKYYESKNDQ